MFAFMLGRLAVVEECYLLSFRDTQGHFDGSLDIRRRFDQKFRIYGQPGLEVFDVLRFPNQNGAAGQGSLCKERARLSNLDRLGK